MRLIKKHISSDLLGVTAGGLCLIHCAVTPILFVAKACTAATSCCHDAPVWWQGMDYFFIIVSFFAIYFTTKNTVKEWVKIALWMNWALLLFAILNVTFNTGLLPESFLYTPALAIVGLHFYNLKYSICSTSYCD